MSSGGQGGGQKVSSRGEQSGGSYIQQVISVDITCCMTVPRPSSLVSVDC